MSAVAAPPTQVPDVADDDHISAAKALLGLGYLFNEGGRLVHRVTGNPFEFVNQAHYERLADVVAEYIQEVMVKTYGMQTCGIELPSKNDFAFYARPVAPQRVPIFVSASLEKFETVLILLCGSGKVAAGQWARKLCINDSLDTGSVLPFLDWAKANNMGVVVLNPNFIPEGSLNTALAHVLAAWDTVICPLPAKNFLMVAHSYGGFCVSYLLKMRGLEVTDRMCAMALTDSVHSSYDAEGFLPVVKRFFCERCINWVGSFTSRDSLIARPVGPGIAPNNSPHFQSYWLRIQANDVTNGRKGSADSERNNEPRAMGGREDMQTDTGSTYVGSCDCPRLSAGTDSHELTTSSAFPSICEYFLDQMQSPTIKTSASTEENT